MFRFLKVLLIATLIISSAWGFFSHKKINHLAVFTLPPDMIGFYKKNIQYITESAVNPDRRRYAVEGEGARHYIDLDVYGDSDAHTLPRYWNEAIKKYGDDSLQKHGILPWNIYRVYNQLKDAFAARDPERILKLSADLGHYIGDAHVPLHTTRNYNGQLTGQTGIHGLWESRLPELYFDKYNFVVGKAVYIKNVQLTAWKIVAHSHAAVDSVLHLEKKLSEKKGHSKFSFETKGKQTIKVYSDEYASAYHQMLSGMVERQLRASIKMTGNIWYTAWVDAGQPDLKALINYKPTAAELKRRKEELKKWKKERSLQFVERESDH